MPYITLQQRSGNIIFAIRKDESHYKHLNTVPKCSFMIYPLTPSHMKPKDMPLPKLNITGVALPLEDADDINAALQRFGM